MAGIGFSHLLVQRAVYGGLCPVRRRRLHQRAAGLVDRGRALGHRLAAAAGPDDGLAGELEAAGRDAKRHGRTAEAAAWLAQAAAISSEPAAADQRRLDALQILVAYGEVAQAETLAARVAAGPDPRRSWLLGTLDFLAGRTVAAEARLREAWRARDPAWGDPFAGGAAAARLAQLCFVAGRVPEAIEWGERAAATGALPAAMRHRALGVLAIALYAAGRGPEGLARLAFLPAAPSEVLLEETDTLALRGMARSLAEDLAGAIADLSAAAARLRAGVPLRSPSLCLSHLALAEYRVGSWDDAVVHAELAVSLARDADRAWEFSWVHHVAAVVPALRGDLEAASVHVGMAAEAAQGAGDPWPIGAAATAQAFLAMARGDLEDVADAAGAVRATGRAHRQGCWPLRLAAPGARRPRSAWAALARRRRRWPSWRRPCHQLARRQSWWPPPGSAAIWPPRPGTRAPPPRRSRPPGIAPRACRCRWPWPSWRSPTPAGCARSASRSRPSPGSARPGSA